MIKYALRSTAHTVCISIEDQSEEIKSVWNTITACVILSSCCKFSQCDLQLTIRWKCTQNTALPSHQCPTVCVCCKCSLLSHPSGSKRTHKQLINTLVLFFSLLSLRLWCVGAMSCWDALDLLLNFCGPVVEVHLHQHQLQPTQYKWKSSLLLLYVKVRMKTLRSEHVRPIHPLRHVQRPFLLSHWDPCSHSHVRAQSGPKRFILQSRHQHTHSQVLNTSDE